MNAQTLHREDVKAAIRKRGSSLAQVARRAAVHPSLVSNVLAGRDTSSNVERALAGESGLPIEEVRRVTRAGGRSA